MSDNDDSIAGREEAGLLPQAPPLGGFSQQAARSAGDITNNNQTVLRQAKEQNRATIVLPNGELGFIDDSDQDYLDHMYLAGKHGSHLTDAIKLVREPKPGYIYVWAAKYNPKGDKTNARTVANIRSKKYEPVLVMDLHEDSEAPIEAHKIAGHADVAGIVDVLLMAVSPLAQKLLYKWKAVESRRRTNRWQSYQKFQDQVQTASRGHIRAEVEAK